MLTTYHNIDKYILPKMLNIKTLLNLYKSSKYTKYIIDASTLLNDLKFIIKEFDTSLDRIKYILENKGNPLDQNDLFIQSIKMNKLNIAKLLFINYDINIYHRNNEIFRFMYIFKSAKILTWFINCIGLVNGDYNNMFKNACNDDDIEFAEWLWTKYNKEIDICFDLYLSVCFYGSINILKWLISINKINIHLQDELLFRSACENGDFIVAECLWNMSNKSINLHAVNEWAFRWACRNGNLKIAKWLWTISNYTINIYAMHEYAFHWAFENDHQDVCEWLCTI
jgi:hypothetical protein